MYCMWQEENAPPGAVVVLSKNSTRRQRNKSSGKTIPPQSTKQPSSQDVIAVEQSLLWQKVGLMSQPAEQHEMK